MERTPGTIAGYNELIKSTASKIIQAWSSAEQGPVTLPKIDFGRTWSSAAGIRLLVEELQHRGYIASHESGTTIGTDGESYPADVFSLQLTP